jgi:hypothetical protein
MNDSRPRKVLFSGYAPVHFLCFLPVYEELRDDGDLDVWLSGGFRRKDEAGERIYDLAGFYDPFPVNPERVIPFDQAREQEFDVAICAHTSGDLLPNRVGKTVQIFHGVSFKNFAVREKVLQYDRLVRGGFDRDGFLRSAGLDVGRPTVLYAPTGGKNNSLETVGEDVISAIVADGRWNLLVKPHDHPKRKIDWFSRLASLECDRMRMARGLDVVEYLLAADLLLTDASSVAVEYTLVDRPMVFIDVPKLLKNVLTRGAPLDLATYGRRIGALAHNAEEVVAEIDRGLAAPAARSELRRAMAGDVFHEPGGAAERVAEVVRWAAGLRPDLPSGVEVLEP